MERKNIIFLSSSYVNLAKLFAMNNNDYDVFLVLDRKFPQDFEDEELDNFYVYTFDKNKQFEKDKEKYFDNLSVFIEKFESNIIVCSNFSKLLSKSFIEFQKFRNSKIKIINVHHGDLRVIENNKMKFEGLNSDIKQFLDEGKIVSTIHLIENEKMDQGKQLAYSYETSFKELKQKGFVHKKEDILNLRLHNVIKSYHERTKVLNLLSKVLKD